MGIIFALLMAYSTFLNYKKKEFSKALFLFWEIIWFCLLLVVFFTEVATIAVKSIGFLRLMDFLTVMGFTVVIFLSMHNYFSTNRIRIKLEKMVREDALKEINNKK